MENSIPRKLFCFGYGYSCDYLGHALIQQGEWQLAGTTRDPEKVNVLRARGIEANLFDWEHPLADPIEMLQGTTHLVISTPPGEEGDPTFLMHAQDIMNIPSIEWVGYLSTTGVYGNKDGAEVYETTELNPTSQRGSRRVMAEKQWQSLNGLPLHIFRLSGIYGPGRSALDSVRAGVARRINKPGHAFGRIHVEDIANTLIASMGKPNPGQAYNVCDEKPAPSHEVIAYACELLGRPPPPMVDFEEADLSPMARSFYMDNRRVKNDKIKSELGVALKYPNFQDGLKGCQEAENYVVSLFGGMG